VIGLASARRLFNFPIGESGAIAGVAAFAAATEASPADSTDRRVIMILLWYRNRRGTDEFFQHAVELLGIVDE
jgi:hypothetical protein